MEATTKEFKGKNEVHVVLNPEDISSLKTIFTFMSNALLAKPPWNREDQKEKYIEVFNWFVEKVRATQSDGIKNLNEK